MLQPGDRIKVQIYSDITKRRESYVTKDATVVEVHTHHCVCDIYYPVNDYHRREAFSIHEIWCWNKERHSYDER